MAKPGGLVLDFSPAKRFSAALDELHAAWAAMPREMRVPLSRLVWLHPNGEVVVYRPPDHEEPKPKDGA